MNKFEPNSPLIIVPLYYHPREGGLVKNVGEIGHMMRPNGGVSDPTTWTSWWYKYDE